MSEKELNIEISKSNVLFQIKKLGFITVKGNFEGIQGNIAFDKTDLENSNFKVSVSPKTVNTGNAKRDEHLLNEDFFKVSEFPKILFHSTSIKKENNMYLAVGKLTMLKETKEISIPFTLENDVLEGAFSLNRKDYGLGSKFPGFFIGNNVEIFIKAKSNS